MFLQAKKVINEKVLHKLLHYNCSCDQSKIQDAVS